MTTTHDVLALDLFERTERAVESFCHLAVDTGITFKVSDISQMVEAHLPPGYPAPTTGSRTRRDMIEWIASDIITGDAYEDE